MKQWTLKAARERRRWTQEDLEAASGVEQSQISRLERGVCVPLPETIDKLEAALELRRGALLFTHRDRVSA